MEQWFLILTLMFFQPGGEAIKGTVVTNIPVTSEQGCKELERTVYLGGYTLWNSEVDKDGLIAQTENRGKHNGLDIHMKGRCALFVPSVGDSEQWIEKEFQDLSE